MKRKVTEREAILESKAAATPTEGLVDLLSAAMRDPSPSIRAAAVRIVAERSVDGAAPFVEDLLGDVSEKVRIAAISCVGAFHWAPPRVLEKLSTLLRDASFLVRIETLEVLTNLRDLTALPKIVPLLSDDNPLVRAFAARSIAALDGHAYMPLLSEAIKKEKEDAAMVGLLEASLVLGNDDALSRFLSLLSSTDYRVRCSTANSLENIPLKESQIKSVLAALVRAEEDSIGVADRSSIARALARLSRQFAGQSQVGSSEASDTTTLPSP